ncbi:MAG: hypothetical protein HFG76_10845 [Hungatella sp.]|nr:hypothetical protein [Hungatella sp.]
MKQLNKRATKILIVLSLLMLTAVGMTIAYYNSQKDFHNKFRTGAPGVAIQEQFDPADLWVPGEEKSKKVWFSNTGELDMYLRFIVEVQWKDGEKPTKITDIKDLLGEDGIITLYWRDSTGENITWTQATADGFSGLLTPVTVTETVEGKNVSITYYYYNKILKAGESTEHVLESVKFNTRLSNDEHEHTDYSNVQIDVTIKGETVLANPEAANDEWKMIVADDETENRQDYITWHLNN